MPRFLHLNLLLQFRLEISQKALQKRFYMLKLYNVIEIF